MLGMGIPALALGWFTVWGGIFWTLLLVDFLIVSASLWWNRAGWATIALVGFVLLCLIFGDITPSWSGVWTWLVDHRWWVAVCAAIYFSGFFAWPFYAWGLLVRDQLRQRHMIRILFLRSRGVPERDLPDEDGPMPEEYR